MTSRLDYRTAMEVAAVIANGIAAGNEGITSRGLVDRTTETLCMLEAAVQEKFPDDAT